MMTGCAHSVVMSGMLERFKYHFIPCRTGFVTKL